MQKSDLVNDINNELKEIQEKMDLAMPGSEEYEQYKKRLICLKSERARIVHGYGIGKKEEVVESEEIFFTLTGCNHFFGSEFLEKGMNVKLKKEPDNEHDKEAIKVEIRGLGHIGYVANSPNTVIGESMSAGRLYDKIGDIAEATILYILPNAALCVLNESIEDKL